MTFELPVVRVLVLSILVLWVGGAITAQIGWLQRFHIPIAITGGLLCSILLAVADAAFGIQVSFDLALRDTLLLVFFSTIGLSAKLQLLREGGKLLAILAVATLGFLIAQNAVGMSVATLLGLDLGVGLIGGSVSLAGGHGTAITWGEVASQAGFPGYTALGLAFATFGLVCGGVVGGPIAHYLIERHQLRDENSVADEPASKEASGDEEVEVSITSRRVLRSLLLLAICVGSGQELNDLLGESGVVLPGFLTSMAVGILLTNGADALKQSLDADTLDLFGDVSLHLFLAMSLMSMPLMQLAGSLGPVFVILAAQVVLVSIFAIFIVFRLAGRDYDAAIIASGIAGLGLGATPVGVANMNAVTSRFGASPKAFLVVPLIGAFLLDILNAGVIQGYIALFR
jgi:ESS family glutamate:Na+ symporter